MTSICAMPMGRTDCDSQSSCIQNANAADGERCNEQSAVGTPVDEEEAAQIRAVEEEAASIKAEEEEWARQKMGEDDVVPAQKAPDEELATSLPAEVEEVKELMGPPSISDTPNAEPEFAVTDAFVSKDDCVGDCRDFGVMGDERESGDGFMATGSGSLGTETVQPRVASTEDSDLGINPGFFVSF